MARRPLRPCIRCGDLIRSGSYCALCRPGADRRTRTWTSTSAAVRSAHVARYGLTCPGVVELGHDPHPVVDLFDLTVDHVVPLAAGGDLLDPSNLRVVCRRINSSRRR